MTNNEVSELLDRAAASVTPAETDPAARLVDLGRRSVRRRRSLGAAGFVAAAVAAVVAVPVVMGIPNRPDATGAPGSTETFGGLTVAVPKGWQTSRVDGFEPCTAQPNTVYLAQHWGAGRAPQPRDSLGGCESEGRAWMVVVRTGMGRSLTPDRLIVKDGQPIQVQRGGFGMVDSMWTYTAFGNDVEATTAGISAGDDDGHEQLLPRVTWPAGAPAPRSGGLVLPATFDSVLGEAPQMVTAQDAATLSQIRAKLAQLREPVPAGEECVLERSGTVALAINESREKRADSITVVLGDATCPQAVSTAGGRVKAPAGLGRQLLSLVEAADGK
ncbi:hypothetical protein AB0M54_41455 [Actinoplanes sp. NPDC051470]|uniref:hypothetical protein n=1 Tax=unclassified Actinoplanes TaxID=2626549 RepID=UPI00343A88CE